MWSTSMKIFTIQTFLEVFASSYFRSIRPAEKQKSLKNCCRSCRYLIHQITVEKTHHPRVLKGLMLAIPCYRVCPEDMVGNQSLVKLTGCHGSFYLSTWLSHGAQLFGQTLV